MLLHQRIRKRHQQQAARSCGVLRSQKALDVHRRRMSITTATVLGVATAHHSTACALKMEASSCRMRLGTTRHGTRSLGFADYLNMMQQPMRIAAVGLAGTAKSRPPLLVV